MCRGCWLLEAAEGRWIHTWHKHGKGKGDVGIGIVILLLLLISRNCDCKPRHKTTIVRVEDDVLLGQLGSRKSSDDSGQLLEKRGPEKPLNP